MEKKQMKKVQVILALLLMCKEGIKNEGLARLITNNFSEEIIEKLINSLSTTNNSEEGTLNLEVIPPIIQIEKNGIAIGFDNLEKERVEPLRLELQQLINGFIFSDTAVKVGSNKWVSEILREKNYEATSIKELEKIVEKTDQFLIELKKIVKITREINLFERTKNEANNYKIHTTFIPYHGFSGRIISHSPSSQNFPSYWKDYIKPLRENERIWELDIKNAEILALAWLAEEQQIYSVLSKGKDLYAYSFSQIFGVDESKISKERRKAMKKIINGITYGMGGRAIATTLNEADVCTTNLTEEQGKLIKERYFEIFPKFKEYQEQQIKTSELITAKGHTFKVSPNYKNIAFGPQNLIATLMKQVLIALDKDGYMGNIINVVHDSIWISSSYDVMNKIKEIMEDELSVLVDKTVAVGIELAKITELTGGKENG